jgi:CheY-like chemotaxis protein
VRELIARVAARLGHEALALTSLPTDDHPTVDAIVLEPAWIPGLEFARTLRERNPGARIVLESIEPDSEARREFRPVRFLVKPFGLADLEQALASALEPGR